MNNIIEYGEFVLNESKIPTMKIKDILDDMEDTSNIDTKVLMTAFKTKSDYIDVVCKKSHHYRVHDMSGKIMNNNRVTFEVIIFSRDQIENIIRTNLIKYSTDEFISLIPTNVTIFGVELNPETFLNVDLIKNTFESYYTQENIIDIISDITGFEMNDKVDKFYIWTKNK